MLPRSEDRGALAQAIKRLHGGEPTWMEVVPIVESHGETVIWAGEVQVFALKEHPRASRCYAWSHETDGGGRRYHAVLHEPPVDSAIAAVRAVILSERRAGRKP